MWDTNHQSGDLGQRLADHDRPQPRLPGDLDGELEQAIAAAAEVSPGVEPRRLQPQRAGCGRSSEHAA